MRDNCFDSFDSRRRKRSRSRSHSLSPSPERKYYNEYEKRQMERERLEEDRRRRMARLRAENEEEEKKMAALESSANSHHSNSEVERTSKAKRSVFRVDESELKGLDEEEQMKRILGFSGGFASTNGKDVEDNQKSAACGAVSKKKARKYRQYMNRKGGFNRPLDKMG
jgi:U4/U6.U5 tri-snRNP-associated protein 3